MISENPEGFVILAAAFGYVWPVSLFAVGVIVLLILLARVKKRNIGFPLKYSLISFFFALILVVYAYYPPAYHVEYTGSSSQEYFRIKAEIEKPVYLFVGLVLLFNFFTCFVCILKSERGARLLAVFVMILAFQITGIAGIYALENVLIAGLD